VAVVDGDLRRSSLGKWAGTTDRPGLSDLIEGTVSLQDTIVKYEEIPIHIVPSGLSKKPAAELLHSRELRTVFGMMAEHFDLILVDSPPVNLITDALLLASGCDAVMLVARAFSTTRKDLERAAHELQTFRVIGTVLNGGTRGHLYRRYGGYY
jgi:capsular exopolysaccharide synthesis family protein